MTRKKKPSIKNRTWEKDRRDRLNKSFDQLAQLLPQYDPSINWTKAEIIQKSVDHIQDLHIKHRNYLQEKDAEALKCYDELIFCLNFFQSRNKQLFELLQNAKIPVPSVKVPKFLVDNPHIGVENNFNNLNTKNHGRPQKYSNQLKEDNGTKIKKTTSVPKGTGKIVRKTSSSLVSPTKENLNIKAIASEPIKPNESTKPEILSLKMAPQTQTATISTGVLLPLIPCSATMTSTAVTNYTPTISCVGQIQPVINEKNISSYKKCKIMNIQTISKGLKLAKDKDGNIKLLPRPTMKIHFRRPDGKVPIPILKRKIVPIKRTRKRKCIRKSAKICEKSTKKTNLNNSEKEKINQDGISAEKPIIPKEKETLKPLDKTTFSTVKVSNPTSPKKCISENCLKSSDHESNDYFSTLQIPQNETNPESLSPTAAFLLTFPVVSTTGGKNPDHDESVFINNNLVTDDTRKDNETCAADSLENLNTFFTTKEYHKYCERVDESKAQQKKDITEKNTTTNYPNSSLVSKSKNFKLDTTSLPHNITNAVTCSEPSVCYTKKSSYYPIQNQYSLCSSNPSNFTFNLTSNAPAALVSSASDAMRQSVSTYSSKMSDLPWTPTVTTNYTSSFTFSLTPSTTVFTDTVATTPYANVVTSSSSSHLNNLPSSTLSEAIPKSSFVSFDYPKLYNTSFPRISHSYSTSTNFTFSLTNPKNSITSSSDSCKTNLISTSSTITKSLQPPYTSYCFDSQTQFSQKDTTNFTFALTRPTSSITSSQNVQNNMFLNNSTISTNSSALVDSGKKPPIIPSSHTHDYEKPVRHMDTINHQKFINKQTDVPVTNSLFCYDPAKSTKLPQKNHINWMTSSEYLLPPIDIGPTTTTPSLYQSQISTASDNRGKRNDISFPHINSEDNLSAWSPSKVIDTSHLMPSTTIPNYYSELTFNPNYTGTNIFEVPKPHNIKPYEQEKNEKSYKTSTSAAAATTNQSNFFSVSQLVDQGIGSSSKIYDSCNKKNSVNKSKDIRKPSEKSYDIKSSYKHDSNHPANPEQYMYHEPQKPTVSNTYSAEALISKKEKHRNYTASYNGNPDFYTSIDGVTGSSNIYSSDNVVDHNYNPNYFYNYVPPSQNFTQETDYLGAYCTDVQYGKNHNTKSQYTFTSSSQRSASAAVGKADNKKLVVPPTVHPHPSAPNLTSYDANYFPVPLTANSSMITAPPPPPPPSDIYDPHHYSHSSSFQPGNWTAKNTLPVYHPQQTISNGDLTSTNYSSGSTINQGVSGNLTNFNLSTICPEINDKVINNNNW